MTINKKGTTLVGADAYNKFESLATLSYSCIKYLIQNNEDIWKLLKYREPDAWNKAPLTASEKAQLIYAGQEDSSQYNVFMDGKQPDVLTEETTLLRIMPNYVLGLDRTIGAIEVTMEVYSHYKINHMSNYTTRVDVIAQQLLATFNGAPIEGIGNLGVMFFNQMADESLRLFEVGQIPFGGKRILFGIYSA